MTANELGPSCRIGPPAEKQPGTKEALGQRRVVSAFRCRVWAHHSRPEEQLTEPACKSLHDSIAKNGQHQPALGRPVTDDPAYDVEIICGARRHAAALMLGRDLLVELRNLSDAEAYVAMYEENLERKNDCPYVQGQILRRALLSGTYASQDELARAFRLSHAKVCRLLMIAQLPSIVVSAFQAPEEIRENWGVALYQLWKSEPPDHGLTRRARALADSHPRATSREVYDALLSAANHDRSKPRLGRSRPVLGADGTTLFREHEQLDHVVFAVSKATLTAQRREQLRRAMIHVLDEQH